MFRSDAGTVDFVVSAGQLTPVIGRTYRVTATGRFNVTPGSSTLGSSLFVDIFGQVGGTPTQLASGGVDATGTGAGVLITSVATWTYSGSPAVSAIKAWSVPNNSKNSSSPYSPAVWDLISLRLEDVTESTTATTQANAAATSASTAAASQTAASQSASAASTSATNAQTYAGQASTSAGQASTSASSANTSAQSAGSYATNSANSATAAGGSASTAGTNAANSANSASAANTSATNASTSANSASSSASSAQTYSQQASASAGTASTQAANASNSASSASTSAVAATNAAAAAQQSYYLAASAGTGALNNNPTFANWTGAAGTLPTGWGDSYQGNALACGKLATGFDSPNAVLFDCTSTYAAKAVSMSQTPSGTGANYGLNFAGSGWYVLEVDVYVHSQSTANTSGAYVVGYSQINGGGATTAPLQVNLSATPDINGAAGLITGRRQWAVLGQITGVSSVGLTVVSNGLALTGASSIEWHKVKLRPASSAEIAGQQALTSANTNTANLASFQSAQTSTNSAYTTSINSLNAAVFTASGGSLQSQITNLSATQATQSATFASQISTLQASAVISANLVQNPTGAQGLTYWSTSGAPFSAVSGAGGNAFVWSGPFSNASYAVLGSTFPLAAGPVSYQCVIDASTATAGYVFCYLQFYNASGATISNSLPPISASLGVGRKLYQQQGLTAPAGTVSAQVVLALQTLTSSGAINVGNIKVEANPVCTAYSDDASAKALSATVTSNSAAIATLQGQLFASYTLTATAGNVVTGLQLLSASGATTVSSVIFQAESFLIKSASGAAGLSPFAYNSATGTLTLQNVVVNTLAASTSITVGPGVGIKVALQSFTNSVSDGQAVTYPNLGSIPIVTFNPTGLSPLGSGQAYQLTATSITPSGFTASLKKVTPGTTTARSVSGSSSASGGPTLQIANPYGNAYNNSYSFSGQGPGGGAIGEPDVNAVATWYQIGGAWYQGGDINYSSSGAGTRTWSGSNLYSGAGTITAFGISYDGANSTNPGGQGLAFSSVAFSTQTGATTVTASPGGESCLATIQPTNGG